MENSSIETNAKNDEGNQLRYFCSTSIRFAQSKVIVTKKIMSIYIYILSDVTKKFLLDFLQHKFETFCLEVDCIIREIEYTIAHLGEWSAIEKVIIIFIIS